MKVVSFIRINGLATGIEEVAEICNVLLEINDKNKTFLGFDDLYKYCLKLLWQETSKYN